MKKTLLSLVAALAVTSAFALDAVFVQSEVSMPYTPSTAVAAGDVLVLSNGLIAVADQAIAASALGSVRVRGIYKFAKDTSSTYVGELMYWDADGNPYDTTDGTGTITTNASGNTWCGFAIEAVSTNALTVKVMLYPVGNVDAADLAVSGNETVAGTLIGSSTISATGFKIGEVSGFSGVVTNLSTLSTNVEYWTGGICTNITRNPQGVAMADLIQTGLAWLTQKRAAYASTSCVLRVGQVNLAVHATLAKRQVEVVGEGGATMIVEALTAIVPAADLTGDVRPKNGDRLTGTGIDFEVRAPSAGAKAWDWADAFGTAVRIFLRERNAEYAPG